jgi:hypothetical protein
MIKALPEGLDFVNGPFKFGVPLKNRSPKMILRTLFAPLTFCFVV